MSATLPPEIQNQTNRVKQLEDQLKLVVARRQQVKAELIDVESALAELEKMSSDAVVYKSIGNILVKSSRDELISELKEHKETLELQEMTLGKQETSMRKQWEQAVADLNALLIKYGLIKSGGTATSSGS
ncbi:MAG: prefoldin subunit beta [Thermoprotei archaeon]